MTPEDGPNAIATLHYRITYGDYPFDSVAIDDNVPASLYGKGGLMLRIDLGFWYKAGEVIHPLTELSGEKRLGDIFAPIFFAQDHLKYVLLQQVRSSFNYGMQLSDILEKYLNEADVNKFDTVISSWDVGRIAKAAQQFETALKAELSIAPSYIVTPKGGYNVDILTLAPALVFPPDLIKLVPESQHDVAQAAKCMAFEISTAAAFHLHRLNEAVVRRYWDAVSEDKKRPKRSSLGQYIGAMEKAKIGADDVLATLKQINNLHRTPVTHLEKDYENVWQAIELFGIVISAISSMLPTIKTHLEPTQEVLPAVA